ncbi:MAG: hypothetical protein UIC64_07630 [Agathobacter sp.]|nr:hypothetical protein [Agathobacter sp.]
MKKKYLLLLGVVTLVAVAAVGGTLASGNRESKKAYQEISERSLGITIVDEETVEGDGKVDLDVLPGTTQDLNYTIMNDEANGYDLYAKVNIFYGWKDENLSSVEQLQTSIEKEYITLSLAGEKLPMEASYETPKKVGDWIITYSDGEQLEMYYSKPLSYGASVGFLDSISFSSLMGNEYADQEINFEVDVKAVQVNNSLDAIAAEWGVYPQISEDGTITSISENR